MNRFGIVRVYDPRFSFPPLGASLKVIFATPPIGRVAFANEVKCMKKGNFMKQYLTATAALLAISAQAQVSGPNRPGPGASPGTFQMPGATSSSIQTTTPSTSSTIVPTTPDTANISVGPPVVNPRIGPLPRTSLGTPDATVPPSVSDSLRSRTTFPPSGDFENGAVGGAGLNQSETRRLTPLPDRTLPGVTPDLPDIT